jgi:hypothetical protein
VTRAMIKTQKKTVLIAAILIIFSIIYPPYYRHELSVSSPISSYIEMKIIYSGWASIFSKEFKAEDGEYEGTTTYYRFSEIRFDILGLEIFGILVLATAVFLVSKKRLPRRF